ncbi:MAG: flavodoxin domain-containing protein [Candidatus Bathyarchaeota archaeon]|nr:flavodoxin domain-containing protein [Candidatus Bathyarchaeota archaeon]MDH5663596.1 flavodoxin domain-containing protein [Candidatus Bathyarchaeota archaeon]
MKALIFYGTRHGATKETSEEIAKILREENFDVKVVNAQEEKVKDISEYELVAVGSGISCNKWVNEAEDFLKKFHKEFEHKKLVLFVSSVKPIAEKEGNTEEVAKIRKAALEDKVSKYGLKPVSMGFFGGVIDFNRMGFLTRKGMEAAFKLPLQKHGFKETEPGAYDLRDWDEIRSWAKELAKKSQE